MWHKTLVEEEVNIEVLKIERSLMLDQSPEEDSRVSIVGNLVISKGIVDTLSRTKALLTMLNLEKFVMIKTLGECKIVGIGNVFLPLHLLAAG